jgi:hypothetical protein
MWETNGRMNGAYNSRPTSHPDSPKTYKIVRHPYYLVASGIGAEIGPVYAGV